MSVRINVKVDLDGVRVRTNQMTKSGQHALINQAHADMNIYVPMKDEDLRNQSTITTDGKSIVWNAPYARYQYYGRGFKYTTPGTGGRWDEKAKSIHMASWLNVAKKGMN